MWGWLAWLRGRDRREVSGGVLHFLTAKGTVLSSLDLTVEAIGGGVTMRGGGVVVATGTAERFAWELPGGEIVYDAVEGNFCLNTRELTAGGRQYIKIRTEAVVLTGMGRRMTDAMERNVRLAWNPGGGKGHDHSTTED